MEKRRWIIALALTIVAVVAIIIVATRRPKTEGGVTTRVIGCIAPLTGNDANYGRSTKRGLDLAIDEVNSDLARRGKRYRYKIVYEDDQMIPKEGVSAYQKLTTANRVPVIVGPFGSKVVLAVAPLAERGGIVLISASATSDEIADAGDFVFRTVPANRAQSRDCANFALNTLKAKTACLLYVNDIYGVTLKTPFEEFFPKGGGTIKSQDAYDSQATDFRTQLTRIKQQKPDVVFFPGYYKEPALILKQAADLGLQEAGIVFLGTDGSCTDDLIRIAGKAAEGSYFSNLAANFQAPHAAMQAFLKAFRKKYRSDPDAYAAYYYDTLMMLAQVWDFVEWDVDNPAATARRIKEALYAMPQYVGITGPTKFDRKGEVSKPFAIMVVKGGKFTVAEGQ
jgi:branched-chain amino acid transport system substrate-binding protein